jgi:hypothetical protein
MIELLAVVLLIAGITLAVSAVPAFRKKAFEHAAQIKSIVDPNAPKQSASNKVNESVILSEPTKDLIHRREIEDFDYSLFER